MCAESGNATQTRVDSRTVFSEILNTVPQAIFWKDIDGVYLGCNEAFARAVGVSSPIDVVGKTVYDLPIAIEDAETYRADDVEVLRSNRPKHHVIESVRLEGGEKQWLEVTKVPLHDRRGEIYGVLGIYQDVTERKTAEEAVRESDERHRFLLAMSTEGIMINVDGYVVDANQVFADLACVDSVRDLIGKYGPDTVPFTPESREKVLEHRASGDPETYDVEIVRPDGSVIQAETSGRNVTYHGQEARLVLMRDITERKRAEKTLAHSRDLLRYVIEHNRSSVAVHDKDLRYVYVSQRYLDEYRVQEKDVIGRHHYDVFPDLPQKWRDVHQRALAGEIISAEDDPYEREDGRVDWTRWECRPWYEADGSIGGIIVYTEIINDRRRTEEQLRSEKEFNERLVDSLPGIFYLYDSELRLRRWNQNHETATGFSAKELEGKTIASWHESDEVRDAAIAGIRETLETDKPGMIEAYLLHKDGRQVPYILTSQRLDTPDGPMMMGVGMDITQRKLAEEKLKFSEAKFATAFLLSPDALTISRLSDGHIVDVNQGFTEATGYTREDVIGRDAGPEDVGLWVNPYDRHRLVKGLTENGEIRDLEAQFRTKSGRIITGLMSSRIIDVGGEPCILCVTRDITEQKRAEEAMKRAEQEKRQFYRDTIKSVTDGKLLVVGEEEVAPFLNDSSMSLEFSAPEELSDARMRAAEYCLEAGLPEDVTGLFLTAVGEAMTNALKHAGSGAAYCGVDEGDVWVSVSDAGPGIAALSLPDALRRGYSSKMSMGMGYSIILDVCDRVMLSTDQHGTTVVLFKHVLDLRPTLALEDIPDTW